VGAFASSTWRDAGVVLGFAIRLCCTDDAAAVAAFAAGTGPSCTSRSASLLEFAPASVAISACERRGGVACPWSSCRSRQSTRDVGCRRLQGHQRVSRRNAGIHDARRVRSRCMPYVTVACCGLERVAVAGCAGSSVRSTSSSTACTSSSFICGAMHHWRCVCVCARVCVCACACVYVHAHPYACVRACLHV
jgi:hypothetical protein